MGSKRSEKLYRFYDKSIESGGEIDAYRLEAQFRDEWCRSIWSILLAANTDKEFHRAIVNCVCSPIDFYQEVLQEDNTVKKVPLQWWADFKKLVKSDGIFLSCGRVKTSIDSTMQWVEKQVETSLAMIEEYMNTTSDSFFDWFMARLASGKRRLTSIHVNRVQSAYLNWLPPEGILF